MITRQINGIIPLLVFRLEEVNILENIKNILLDRIKKKNINTIFETREDDKIIIALLLNEECFIKKERLGNMLIKIRLNLSCDELR